MKNKVYVVLATLLIVLSMSRCKQDEPYTSLSVLSAPEATLNITDVKDSSFVLSLTSDMKGYASFAVYDDTSATAPTQKNLIEQNLSAPFSGLSAIDEGGTLSWTIGPLDPNKNYEIFAATSNADGVISEIVTQIIKTTDNVSPTLVGFSPLAGSHGIAANSTISLAYDESIAFDPTKSVSLTYYNTGRVSVIPAENISVSGRKLTIQQVETPVPGELIMLNMQEGAVKDLVGNLADSVYTAVVDGAIEGNAFWYVALEPVDMVSETPANGSPVTDQNFAITIKYASDMDFAGGDLPTMTYYDGFGVYSFEIPADYIVTSPADSTVTIYKPEAPDQGVWVSLSIPEGVFTDSKGNPNVAVESKADGTGQDGLYWLVSYGYTRDMVLGDYTISGTSYWAGYDEAFDVTIVADPDNADQILIQGLLGSPNDIVGVFDGDFATITFPSPQVLGNLDANNPTEVYQFEGWSGAFDAFVNPDGSFVFQDWWLIYIYGADGSDIGYYNLFTSSSASKTVPAAAALTTSSDMLKSAKIKVVKKIPRNSIVR